MSKIVEEISKEDRRIEYEKFYIEKGIEKEALLKANETEDGKADGYMCVCCFCDIIAKGGRSACKDHHSCCKTGVPCKYYQDNIKSIEDAKALSELEATEVKK